MGGWGHLKRGRSDPGWKGERQKPDLETIVANHNMLDLKVKVRGGADLDQTEEFRISSEDS